MSDTCLTEIQRAGSSLELQWAKSGYADSEFPALAERWLTHLWSHLDVDPWAFVETIAFPSRLSRQSEIDKQVSELPLTVWRGERFYVECLFWDKSTLAIHDHGFCGAHMPIYGTELVSRHTFSTGWRANAELGSGTLTTKSIVALRPGTASPIYQGPEGIHFVYYVDRPVLSLVARTYYDTRQLVPNMYLQAGVTLPLVNFDDFERSLAALEKLASYAPERFVEVLPKRIAQLDVARLWRTFNFFNCNHPELRSHLGPLLEALFARTPSEQHRRLREGIEEYQRRNHLVVLRRRTTSFASRAMLATLLVSRTQQDVRKCLGALFPGESEHNALRSVVQASVADNTIETDDTEGTLSILSDALSDRGPRGLESSSEITALRAKLESSPSLKPFFSTFA